MPDLSPDLTITSAGDDAFTVTLTSAQLLALANTIDWNVDMDTVRFDNGEPDRADFLRRLADSSYVALGTAIV